MTLTPIGGRKAALQALALFAALTLAPAGQATVRHDQLPLRPGAAGPRVAGLQWMLSGARSHRPNVFTIAGTYTTKPNGYFGPRTAAAVYAYKYRLGYPMRYNRRGRPLAGAYFFALLRGQKTRPPLWVANAARRVAAIEAGPSKQALRIRALELTQLGVQEQPLGSNWGPQVAIYQAATGALQAAWCVSFQQWSFKTVGPGTFADDTASVYYAADFFAARNLLHALPKVGALVLFVDYDSNGLRIPGTGHMGYVVKTTASGYASIEGNYANGVHEVYHGLHDRGNVFAYLPNVA